jgi:hypothetical protein
MNINQLNQLTKVFFRQVFLEQSYIESEFYIRGEVYYKEELYFCFKEDIKTKQLIVCANLYPDKESGDWVVEEFCIVADDYSLDNLFLEYSIEDEFGIINGVAIGVPLSYVIESINKDIANVYGELEYLSQVRYQDSYSSLDIFQRIPWRQLIKDCVDVIFSSYKAQYFYYITSFENACSIIDTCFYSRNELEENRFYLLENIGLSDISNSEVQKIRQGKKIGNFDLHNYTNFYLNPFNPMIYSLKSNNEKILVFGVSPVVSIQQGSYISDGNAASSNTCFYSIFEGLEKINWSILFSNRWSDKLDGKRIRCAEILISSSVSSFFIEKLFFISDNAKKNFLTNYKIRLTDYLNQWNNVNSNYFYGPDLKINFDSHNCYDKEANVVIDYYINLIESISDINPAIFG